MRALRSRQGTPIALAYAAFVLIGVSVGSRGVLLPAQMRDYGVDKATVGITFLTASAGFVLGGLAAGTLIHRFGSRIALVAGGGAYVAAGLCTATRPPFLALVIVQVLAGYGTGVLESVLNAYLTALPGATTLLNRLHAFFGVGALLGPLLAAWILGFASWTAVWLVLALAGLPLLAGFLVAYPRPEAEASAPQAVAMASEPPRGRLLAAALRQRGVLLGAAFLAIYVGMELSVGNWGFSYLVEERGQRDLFAGYAISGYWLGLTLGRVLIGPVAARIGLTAVGLTLACLAGATATTALTWLLPVVAATSAGFVLLGFFFGPIFPTTMAVAPKMTISRLVPTAIGVMNAGSVVGGSLLPWLAGAIAQRAGVWTLLPFATTLALLQMAVWWRMVERMRTAQDERPHRR